MTPPYEALRGARIIATLPLPQENGGWFHQAALQLIAAMRHHGAEVFPLDVGYFHNNNLTLLFSQLDALREFRPEMVVSTPAAVHAMHCKTGNVVAGDDRYAPNNLFIDNLKLPTIFIWDTMADLFTALGVPRVDPDRSRQGVLADLRDQLNNPLCFHCAFDQQHVDGLRELGVLTTPQVRVRLGPAYPHHVAFGDATGEDGYDEEVAFTGNLFSPRPQRSHGRTRDIIETLRDRVIAAFDRDMQVSYWDAVQAARAELGETDCRSAKLMPDESFFWEYLSVDVMSSLITHSRLRALGASRHPVSVYGLMFDPLSAHLLQPHPHLTLKGAVDYLTGMPRLNRRSKVTLDVVTAHFPTSTTIKVLNCFASGGVCLFNAKPAFRAAFGSAADQVMYRDFDDMNAKLDHLLSHDRERAEIAAYFKSRVQAEHSFIGLLAELVAWVKETRR
jgi:Glycosyl transferases group 1